MISFFPFPYPVVTPLGEGYAVYVSANPMWENDSWCVQLDDGRILHFSTNQLRGVANGTYEIAPPKPAAPLEPGANAVFPKEPIHYAVGTGTACGAGGKASTDATKTTCAACCAATRVPDDMNPLFARWKPGCDHLWRTIDGRRRCARCKAVSTKPEPPPRPPLETLRKWSASRGLETKVLKHPQVIARPVLVRCDECDWTYPFVDQAEASQWAKKHPHGLKP